MKTSEFAGSFAQKKTTYEVYAEDPSGLYEYVIANPQKFVPYVTFALAGLQRFKKPVNEKTLSEQFSFVLHQWAAGFYDVGEDGKVKLVRDEENRRQLEKLNREAYRAYRSKGYYDSEPEIKHYEFIYTFDGDGEPYDISENYVGTREGADEFYRNLRECGYYNISVFCPEDEM